MEILTAPLQIGTQVKVFSAQFPGTKGPGNLTPNSYIAQDVPVQRKKKIATSNVRKHPKMPYDIGVSEAGSAKTGTPKSAIDFRIDDAGSILKFHIGFSP